MPQLSSYMQYYSMVRYFTHHSSLKGVKIQSLNLLYGVYIVCVLGWFINPKYVQIIFVQ